MHKPSAGAAGGLGAALMAFTAAITKPGAGLVIEIIKLEKHLKEADLVITGEGLVDAQTAFGKAPSGVAKVAKQYHVPVIAIGGALADDAYTVFAHGIDSLDCTVNQVMSQEDALYHSKKNLEFAAERVIRTVLVGKKIANKKRIKNKE